MKTESLSSDSMHICGCYLGPCLPGHGAGGVSQAPLEEWFHGWGDEVLADPAAAACGHHQRPSRVLPQGLHHHQERWCHQAVQRTHQKRGVVMREGWMWGLLCSQVWDAQGHRKEDLCTGFPHFASKLFIEDWITSTISTGCFAP